MKREYFVIPTRALDTRLFLSIWDSEEKARKAAFECNEPAAVLKYVTDIVHFTEKKEAEHDKF